MADGPLVTITIHPLPGIPEVTTNSDLPQLLLTSIDAAGLALTDDDIVVVTHKIVSKAEGAVVPLVGDENAAYRKVVLDEAVDVIRRRGDLVIARTHHGFVCANAGVDRSNTAPGTAVLLPRDPDRSAHRLRMSLEAASGASIVVIVSDTFGRPWRRGLVDIAIGLSGAEALLDLKDTIDASGRPLSVTEIALIDEVAAAADLVMGKSAAIPAAVVRGLRLAAGSGRASDLVRPPSEDLFL
jgi:coenzyme F420-0:L-glutamate ligase / coenzyme F420-1:gamma-L-glutamate ligase